MEDRARINQKKETREFVRNFLIAVVLILLLAAPFYYFTCVNNNRTQPTYNADPH